MVKPGQLSLLRWRYGVLEPSTPHYGCVGTTRKSSEIVEEKTLSQLEGSHVATPHSRVVPTLEHVFIASHCGAEDLLLGYRARGSGLSPGVGTTRKGGRM